MRTTDVVRDSHDPQGARDHKLDYYGASYGTYIGSIYATMFPNRVGKMVLDATWTRQGTGTGTTSTRTLRRYQHRLLLGWIARNDNVFHLGTSQRRCGSSTTHYRR